MKNSFTSGTKGKVDEERKFNWINVVVAVVVINLGMRLYTSILSNATTRESQQKNDEIQTARDKYYRDQAAASNAQSRRDIEQEQRRWAEDDRRNRTRVTPAFPPRATPMPSLPIATPRPGTVSGYPPANDQMPPAQNGTYPPPPGPGTGYPPQVPAQAPPYPPQNGAPSQGNYQGQNGYPAQTPPQAPPAYPPQYPNQAPPQGQYPANPAQNPAPPQALPAQNTPPVQSPSVGPQ